MSPEAARPGMELLCVACGALCDTEAALTEHWSESHPGAGSPPIRWEPRPEVLAQQLRDLQVPQFAAAAAVWEAGDRTARLPTPSEHPLEQLDWLGHASEELWQTDPGRAASLEAGYNLATGREP
jgi:hypothetical protein